MPKRHRPGASAGSVIAHIEEIVLATSGEDAFELVFALAATRIAGRAEKRNDLGRAIREVARQHPELSVAMPGAGAGALLARIDALLTRAMPVDDPELAGLDAIFESLVPRLAKGDKGQFFTPRSVVKFVIRALSPRSRDVVVDPACGSGAFLAHARAAAKVTSFGCDVDARAIRVARLLAIAQGRDPAAIVRGDGLRHALPTATVVATNPPFAGRALATGFEVARVVRSPERDVLFLERSLALLGPGGRLGIVLPYNKASGSAFSGMRRWLVDRARVYAVVGLPRETFMPHTSQRTFVLFAKKRGKEKKRGDERMMFVVSERAAKNGEVGENDLDEVSGALVPFLEKEAFFA